MLLNFASPTNINMVRFASIIIYFFIFSVTLVAQDNYEIQVYGSQTMEKHFTMFELHSNFTFDGSKQIQNGVLPTDHIVHETIEITHGFTDWMEVGFYFFNAIGDDKRTNYVGSHIRPRVMLPEKYKFPVGLSFSAEVGYQKRTYSEDDWTLELRPIIDKKLDKLYMTFNPVFGKAIHGLNSGGGFVFSPNFKVSYDVTKKIAPGLEYYGSLGVLNNLLPTDQQQHQLFITLDLDLHPDWEFNVGYGLGFTAGTDKSILKFIVGYRLHGKKA